MDDKSWRYKLHATRVLETLKAAGRSRFSEIITRCDSAAQRTLNLKKHLRAVRSSVSTELKALQNQESLAKMSKIVSSARLQQADRASPQTLKFFLLISAKDAWVMMPSVKFLMVDIQVLTEAAHENNHTRCA